MIPLRSATVLRTACLAFGLSALYFWLQGDIRLDWADEGFLWYGVQHVRLGEVPIRDFQSYDPGRYYWCAAFSWIFGKGALGVRASASVFQGLVLTCGLLALRRAVKNPFLLAGAGILAVSWMLWNFRYFDAGIPIIAIFLIVRLLEKPSPRRLFAAAAFAGISLFFGLNHGMYILLSVYGAVLYGEWKGLLDAHDQRSRLWLLLGLLAGLLPLIGFLFFCPGFWSAYWDRFSFFSGTLSAGQTNQGGSIPWPWTMTWAPSAYHGPYYFSSTLMFANVLAQGLAFLSLLVFCFYLAVRVLGMKKEEAARNPVPAACFFVGVCYLYHVFSRPDITHLGEGAFPFIAAALALSASRKVFKWIGVVWLTALTLFAPVPLGNLCFWILVPKDTVTRYDVGGESFRTFKQDAMLMEGVKRIVTRYVGPGEDLLLAPVITTAYCVLERSSPLYEIYFMHPPSAAVERQELEEMERKKVRWAIISEGPAYGRDDLALPETHPALWEYLAAHYEIIPTEGLPAGYVLAERKA